MNEQSGTVDRKAFHQARLAIVLAIGGVGGVYIAVMGLCLKLGLPVA